ncbi:MAG: DNA repair protein RecO [Planctomycetaceae bacterium]|nr:DNA repair protein RecO [Planctomycetaceae bacterium]
MSLEKTDAIVLKTVEWSETSLVVTLFTKDFGKISAIAKGARRLKSPFESALDLLSLSSVVFLKKSGESLDLLTEAKLLRRFRSAQVGLLPLYCGYYASELIHALTENHEPIPGLLDSLCHALNELDRQANPSPQAGGVLCPNCTSMQRSYMRIRPQTLQALEFRSSQIADWPLANFVAEQPPPPIVPAVVRAEIRLVMEQIVICLSDRRLRMLDYLEDLKR